MIPDTKHKNKHINTLKAIKAEEGIGDNIYKRLCQTGIMSPQSSMSYPKSIGRTPLGPIVSNKGAVTIRVVKELTHILRPLVGYSTHLIRTTHVFGDQEKTIRLEEGKGITSYDMKVLFSSNLMTLPSLSSNIMLPFGNIFH